MDRGGTRVGVHALRPPSEASEECGEADGRDDRPNLHGWLAHRGRKHPRELRPDVLEADTQQQTVSDARHHEQERCEADEHPIHDVVARFRPLLGHAGRSHTRRGASRESRGGTPDDLPARRR
jgi:hypothetical protein